MEYVNEVWRTDLYKLQQQAPKAWPILCQYDVEVKPTFYGLEYHGNISRDDAENLLCDECSGAYLIRDGQRSPGTYTLVIKFDDSLKNYKLYYDLNSQQHYVGFKYFEKINDLVQDGLIHLYIESRGAMELKKIAESNIYEESPFYKARYYTLQINRQKPVRNHRSKPQSNIVSGQSNNSNNNNSSSNNNNNDNNNNNSNYPSNHRRSSKTKEIQELSTFQPDILQEPKQTNKLNSIYPKDELKKSNNPFLGSGEILTEDGELINVASLTDNKVGAISSACVCTTATTMTNSSYGSNNSNSNTTIITTSNSNTNICPPIRHSSLISSQMSRVNTPGSVASPKSTFTQHQHEHSQVPSCFSASPLIDGGSSGGGCGDGSGSNGSNNLVFSTIADIHLPGISVVHGVSSIDASISTTKDITTTATTTTITTTTTTTNTTTSITTATIATGAGDDHLYSANSTRQEPFPITTAPIGPISAVVSPTISPPATASGVGGNAAYGASLSSVITGMTALSFSTTDSLSSDTSSLEKKVDSPAKYYQIAAAVTTSNHSALAGGVGAQQSPQSGQSLADQEKQHNFKTHTFRGPHWCDFCTHFMWGLVAQGVKCQDCGFQAHRKCSDRVPHDCLPDMKRLKRIFGVELTSLGKAENRSVPVLVIKLISLVECRGLEVEGIYRVSGNTEVVELIKAEIDKDIDSVDLEGDYRLAEIHNVTSLIKLFFRQLPIPLVTLEVSSVLIDLLKYENDSQSRLEKFKDSLLRLPLVHYATLKYLMNHLYRLTTMSELNKMTVENLAIVFAPSLISHNPVPIVGSHSNQQSPAMSAVDVQQLIHRTLQTGVDLVEDMIRFSDTLFVDELQL